MSGDGRFFRALIPLPTTGDVLTVMEAMATSSDVPEAFRAPLMDAWQDMSIKTKTAKRRQVIRAIREENQRLIAKHIRPVEARIPHLEAKFPADLLKSLRLSSVNRYIGKGEGDVLPTLHREKR